MAVCAAALGVTAACVQAAETMPVPALPALQAAQHRLLDVTVAGPVRVAVGQHGVILRAVHGDDWRQRPSPTSAMLTRVRFVDDRQGWILGHDGSLLYSADGGESWQLRHHDAQIRALYDLYVADAQLGLAVGAFGVLLETRDGGRQWTVRPDTPFAELGMHLYVLVPLDDGSLLAAGERGLIARSRDQGRTWTLLDSPYAGSWFGALARPGGGVLLYGMRGQVFVAPRVHEVPAVEVADWDPYGRVNAEDPAALGWRQVASPVAESLFGADCAGDGRCLFVGVNGAVLSLDTDATTLQALPSPAAETLAGVTSVPEGWLAVGRRGVVHLDRLP